MMEPAVAVPFLAAWEGSAHNATDTEPFRHWDGDDPAEVPTSCAKCHSTQGYEDFMGADGSEAGVVDAAVPAKDVYRYSVRGLPQCCHPEPEDRGLPLGCGSNRHGRFCPLYGLPPGPRVQGQRG